MCCGCPSESVLRYCAVWNTNARNCQDAQAVVQVLLTHIPPDELLLYQGARAHLEALIPYTGQYQQGPLIPYTGQYQGPFWRPSYHTQVAW